MPSVEILITGYTSADIAGHSCSTICLVRDRMIKMIVDPGTVPNQRDIIKKLRDRGLTVNDINVVCITHAHTDHYRNIGLFPKARTLDYWGWWQGDVWLKCNGKISPKIELIKTPGHSYDSITLLARTKDGIIAICGDVFWKQAFPKKDLYASDLKALTESRKQVLKKADFIIPGHGGMYQV